MRRINEVLKIVFRRNMRIFTHTIRKKAITILEDIFEKGFYIPKNVIIIGTMNDIDRSVESMDFALRRRFVWREITVEEDETKLAKTIMEILFPDETWDEESLKSKISLQVAKYILYINKQTNR